MGGFAWVTLATNDSYSLGALVLAHSLRRVNTAHQLVILITPGVSEAMKTQLSAVFNVVKLVDVLDSRDADNLALLARPELGITFTKLHCWRLTQYDKCVFLDADTLVLQNCDELFDREELSAAPDAGWPDCFNSGVFVYKPSDETFKAIIEFALIHGSFDGGDQGLLNLFFSDWPTKDIQKHLPFIYNMVSTASYSYLPAFKQFGRGLKIIHFIGAAKPWLQPFNTETGVARVSGESQQVSQFVQFWWDLFCSNVHPSLSTEMTQHRLCTSYDFTAPLSPPPEHKPNFGPRAPTPPPPSFRQSDQSYMYYDPWDDVGDIINGDTANHEDFQNSNRVVETVVPECDCVHDLEFNEEFRYEDSAGRESAAGVCVGGGDTRRESVYSDSFPQRPPEPSPRPTEVPHSPPPVVAPHAPPAPPLVVALPDTPGDLDLPHSRSPSPTLDAGLAGALASVTLGAPLTAEQTVLEEHLRRQGWEQGNIDYMGKDSFSNIWQKICDTVLSGPQPYLPPAPEAPAPVAPVAAPVYVSSVEISPAGPIDTSPPASYAPVSALQPTVVASDSEAAKAALSETKTVPPEPKSPSVPELISTEGLKPTIIETSSQPPVDTPTSSAEPAVVTTTTTTAADSTPAPAETVPPSPPILLPTTITELSGQAPAGTPATAPLTPIPLPSTPTELASPDSLTPALVTPTPDPTTPVSVPTPPVPAPITPFVAPTTPISVPATPVAVPATPVTVPTTPIPAPTTPVSVPTTPVPAPTTPVSVPTTPVPAPTTPVSVLTTPIPAPTTTVSVPTTPVAAPTTPVDIPITPVPVPTTPIADPAVPVPVAPAPASIPSVPSPPLPGPIVVPELPLSATPIAPPESSAPSLPTPSDISSVIASTKATPSTLAPVTKTSIATEAPVPEVLPLAPIVTVPSVKEQSSSDVPVKVPPAETPAPVSTPQMPLPATPLDLKINGVPVPSPVSTEKTPAASDKPAAKAPEGSPGKTEPVSPAPVQPQTPTVTEPTPPTSPAAASVEAPLAVKLQVDPEVPATPPVGSSSTAPPLASEEPPVPPKRKGGAKGSQDSKNHKGGGKPSKGKK